MMLVFAIPFLHVKLERSINGLYKIVFIDYVKSNGYIRTVSKGTLKFEEKQDGSLRSSVGPQTAVIISPRYTTREEMEFYLYLSRKTIKSFWRNTWIFEDHFFFPVAILENLYLKTKFITPCSTTPSENNIRYY